MTGPWERYAGERAAPTAPWQKYQNSQPETVPVAIPSIEYGPDNTAPKADPVVMQGTPDIRDAAIDLPGMEPFTDRDATPFTEDEISTGTLRNLVNTLGVDGVNAFRDLAFGLGEVVPDPMTTITKAARDTGVALTTLPSDIAGEDAMSEAISRSVPEIVPEGANAGATEVGADVLRYAVPGVAGGIKGAQLGEKLVRTPGALQGIAKYLMGMLGAASSDAAVTKPESDISVGDVATELTGVDFPTTSEPDDSRLEKRLKIGAETGVVQPVADAAIAVGRAGKTVGSKVVEGVRGYRSLGDAELEKSVAKELQGKVEASGAIPEQVADDIEKTVANTPEYANLTSGQASNNTALMQLERGTRNASDIHGKDVSVRPSTEMDARAQSQAQAIDDEIAEITTQVNPDRAAQTDAAKKAVGDDIADQRGAAQGQIDEAANDLAAKEAKADGQLEQKEQLAQKKPDAVESVGESLETAKKNLDSEKNKAFDVDPEGTVKRKSQAMHDSWAGVNKTDGSPGAKGSVNFIRTTLREETVEFLDGLKRGGKVPFKHLQSARNDISNALTAAQKANDGEAVKRLKGLKRDLNNETERLAKQSGGDGKVMEVAQKTADAVDFYQHTYAPLLREGNGKKFNAAVRSHANNGTEVQSFFKPDKAGQSAADEAKRLKKLTGHADDPVAAARDVRNLIMADMATTTNNLNKGAIDNYISTHSALLKEFPEAKGVLERLSRNVNATADELVQAKKAFKDASDAMKLTEGQINKSRAAQFLEADDVVSVAKKALNSSSPEKEITELLRMAARDETGQAKKGIEQAVSDALYGMVTNANRSVAQNAENFRTSLAKTEALLRKDSVRKALTRVYGEKGMKALDDVRDVLTKTARKTSTAGSDTAANVAQSQTISSENLRIMMAAYFGITKGRGIFTISKYASNLIRGDVDAKLARILVDVSTNPKKAAAFLRMREPVKVNGKFRQALEMNSEIDKSKKSLKTFLANNFPEILASDSDDKE